MTWPGVLLATPPFIPPVLPVDPGRYALEMMWVDGQGVSWPLTDTDSGLVLMRGVRGLGAPTFVHYRDELSGTNGSYWRGYRTEAREVFWPLHVFSDGSSQDWVGYNRALWRGLSPSTEGTWVVKHEDGSTRRLRLRYTKGGEEAFDLDPVFFGWATYGIYFQADQPYWEGDPVKRRWETTEPTFFFGDDDEAPPFYISNPPTPEQATLTNPGDIDTWPVWTLEGPLASAELGVAGRTVSVPFVLGEDDVLVIDTRPTEQTAILNGTIDKTGDLGSFGFAKVPHGTDVPITVTMAAVSEEVGAVTVELTPLYEWGI